MNYNQLLQCGNFFGLAKFEGQDHIVHCGIDDVFDSVDVVTHFLGVSSLDSGRGFPRPLFLPACHVGLPPDQPLKAQRRRCPVKQG